MRLWLAFTFSSEELDELKWRYEKEEAMRIREATKDYLELCVRHQPKSPGSHYGEMNCDHCKLQKENDNLKKAYKEVNIAMNPLTGRPHNHTGE